MMTKENIKGLLKQAGEQPVLSLYLDVDNAVRANQADPPAWRIWLKNFLRRQSSLSKGDHWHSIKERAAAYFEYYQPASKGMVAFFGPDWEQVFPLPVTIDNQGWFGNLLIGPLLGVMSDNQPYLIVRVSRKAAHFYIGSLGQTVLHHHLEIDLEEYDFAQKTLMPATAAIAGGHGGLTQGSNRDAFEDMIDEHRMRFYREVAEHTHQLLRDQHIERIFLDGSDQAVHAVHNMMPDTLRKAVVEVLSLPGHYTEQEIFEQVQPKTLAHEQAEARARVREIIDSAHAGGRAVLGPEAAQYALKQNRVEKLFLSREFPDIALANDLALSALNNNSEVESMSGEAADILQDEGGGVAAKLYYSM